MYQWYYTDTAKNSQLTVPENYYQRDMTSGWNDESSAQYLKTVFAGQAPTPFVVNIKRKEARVVDGGHRLNALLRFKRNEIGMQVGSKRVLFNQLPETDQEHFDAQSLQILEFKNIPISDEIGVYIKLNSGLPFSFGEKLAAMVSINDVVKVGSLLINGRHRPALPSFDTLSSILRKESSGKGCGRRNELMVSTFLAYNLHFRRALSRSLHGPDASFFTSLGERFVQAVCGLNGCAAVAVPHGQVDAVCDEIAGLVGRVAALYAHVTSGDDVGARARTGQTAFRRLVVCMAAVTDIPDLDPDLFKRLLETVPAGRDRAGRRSQAVRRLLTSPVALNSASIARIAEAYEALRLAAATAAGAAAAGVAGTTDGAPAPAAREEQEVEQEVEQEAPGAADNGGSAGPSAP